MDNPIEAFKGSGKSKKLLILAAVGAAGFVTWQWMNKDSASSDNVVTETSSTDAEQASTGILGSNVGGSENTGNSSNTESSSITSNDAWFDAAVTKLANAGWDSAAVQSALGDFVTGQKLTEDEAKIVRAAVGAMGGYPPGGPSTITVIPGVTDASKLSAPTGVKVTAHTANSVSLSWTAVSGATEYRVYRADVAGNVGSSADNAITIGGLSSGVTYKFNVAAGVGGGKMGPRSATVSATTSAQKLTAPKGLKIPTKGSTWVSLTWEPTYPGQYLIQRSGHTGYTESTNNSQRISGLKPRTRYSFRVAASQPNSRTPGPWSGYVSVTTSS